MMTRLAACVIGKGSRVRLLCNAANTAHNQNNSIKMYFISQSCVMTRAPSSFRTPSSLKDRGMKGISDSPFKNITVGTVINTTTAASPNTPRSTFAMETCPRREVPKVEDPAPKLTPAGKREQASTNHCFLRVSEVRNQSSSVVQQLRPSRRRRLHQSCGNSGFAVLYYLSFKGGTIIVRRSKVRHTRWVLLQLFPA